VFLITGSGPQDRDETLRDHKTFLVLSDYLTRQGIVVLRADDRGVGKSEGTFAGATTADFATDAEAALAYLKTRPEVDHRKTGLIGHSEGGIIAPLVASRNQDVAFIVMLAGSGVPGDQIIMAQTEAVNRASGLPPERVAAAMKQERAVLTWSYTEG
jgi:alpha/beta superfamily hydrolase